MTPQPVDPQPDEGPVDSSGGDPAAAERGRADDRFSLGWGRLAVLLVAVSFLAGAVGWAIGQRDDDPLSAVDVGFLQDMDYHHTQAIQMSILLLAKDDVDDGVKHYAQEILMAQSYEQGLFNAILDRFGHPVDAGPQAMGWMGRAVPRDEMPGLATDEQMHELQEATGDEAAALWIALMSEHHLAGLHMGDWAARKGSDPTVVNIARSMVRTQRGEVIDLNRYRESHDLPIPEGFTDPTADQRLDPLSTREP